MAITGCIDLEDLACGFDGMSHCQYPSAAAVGVRRSKKKRVGGMTVNGSANPGTGLDLECVRLNGYVYSEVS